jgi:hypothetical protein
MARRSATAAHFAAVLELAKRGQDRPAAGRDLRAHPAAPEGRDDGRTEPESDSLFDAPPMGEQERMVEAILFAVAEPVTVAELPRACRMAATRPRRWCICASAMRGGG